MKRLSLLALAAGATVLTACGGEELTVQAQLQDEDGAVIALEGLPVRALPYDRDQVFDSLSAAYSTPEPQIPAELSALQDSIAVANTQWANATARWNAGRDSLQGMNERLAAMSRASGDYIVLYNQVNAMFDQVAAAEQTMNQQFQRFTALQQRYTTQAEEIRRAREQWADAAFADIDDVIEARLDELRLQEYADTTDANGVARFNLKDGQWWITARYELPFEELYWNIPVTIGGAVEPIVLNRQTARVRPKL